MPPTQFHLLCNTGQDALSNSTQSLKPSLSFFALHADQIGMEKPECSAENFRSRGSI